MNPLFFDRALLPAGWTENVLIETDHHGKITAVTPNSTIPESVSSGALAVPGMPNLHSHAFQRAMAGLGEWHSTNTQDSFWSWREVMYRFVQLLRPQDLYAIATQLYVEMLEAGFTAVGEFHYLHHQPDMTAYDNLAEMSEQVMRAANEAGIAQTLLPVLYQQGGFNGAAIQDSQRRFYNDTDQFLLLVERCKKQVGTRHAVGIAPHSLRAVTPENLDLVLKASADGPIHIHIAEQVKEVDDCLAWSGARPVQYLMDHYGVDARWCLVHATHMNDAETKALANADAVAGLCPITEANLGDGIFNGTAYQQAGGSWGIGSDSHVRIDLAEELRTYEYSQRLRDLKRNRIGKPGQATGRALFETALAGGAQALAQQTGSIAIGSYCDIVSLDIHHPVLCGKRDDDCLNSWVFSGDKTCVTDVWVSGKQIVKTGKHYRREPVAQTFAKTMQYLMSNC